MKAARRLCWVFSINSNKGEAVRQEPAIKPACTGYGLGLSLCKTIMEAHGGRIEIDSTSNVGTTVTLVLPAYQSG
jgi:signal transduction histidine kinase